MTNWGDRHLSHSLLIILKIDESSILASEKIGDPKPLEPKPDTAMTGVVNTPPYSPPRTTTSAPISTGASFSHSDSSLSMNRSVAAPKSVQARPSNGGERPPTVIPIEGLSPYQNKWTIQVRVTQKSDMKHWSNAKGDGKLFNCTFLDNTGEIKATAFNAAADELFDKIREGAVYYVSRARVNVAKKKFSTTSNDYEITLEKTSEVIEVSYDIFPAIRL